MKILWSQEKELQDSIQRKNNEIDRLKKQLNQQALQIYKF